MAAVDKLQILCLHGKRQDAEIFSQRLHKLTRRLQPIADFTFVDAPFVLDLEEGQTVPMRTWWTSEGTEHPSDEDLAAACDAIRRAPSPPCFDIILGFSQGGAFGAYLAATREGGKGVNWGGSIESLKNLKMVIVSGAYALPGFPRGAGVEVSSLHIMSLQDECVNCSQSEQLGKMFVDAKTHMHELGHALPVRAGDLDVYQAFVTECTQGAAAANISVEATEEQKGRNSHNSAL